MRAFIKVQDGCDNHCTYCVTRIARGASRSRPIEDVLVDIRSALEGGCQEVVLTGVHLGAWGADFMKGMSLEDLVKAILANTETARVRLSSLEPWDIKPKFFELWRDPRLCRHLHLPLQSGCATTLRRMGRKITPGAYAELINEAHRAIPAVAITTDIITGFPGETEAEFSESIEFTAEMNFANGHVFTFSARPGTTAMNLPDKIPSIIGKQRNARITKILQDNAIKYREKQIGKNLQVLWEKVSPIAEGQWQLSGLSDNYVQVHSKWSSPCRNQIMTVHINGLEQGGLSGEISAVQLSI